MISFFDGCFSNETKGNPNFPFSPCFGFRKRNQFQPGCSAHSFRELLLLPRGRWK